MSFLSIDKRLIEVGDTAVVYINVKVQHVMKIAKGAVHQIKYGAVRHDELIGKPYGLRYQCSRGYVYILRPTPELWTVTLPHRTQILYFTDIALITTQLELRPGKLVGDRNRC